MKLFLHISVINLFLLTSCLGQPAATPKVSKAFTASINDSTQVEVYLRFDDRGGPDTYYCHVNTPVCEEGLCKLMVIDVYWDLLGNFLRYELPAGEALTKLDHQEFTPEDHEQLKRILSDRGSILRDYPASDLVDTRIVKTSNKNVDAVSSATRVDVKDAVVGGAVYSTYVLWHIVNGPIASRIVAHARPMLTRERVEKMFYSSNFYYQYHALNSISPEDSVKYLAEIIHLVKNGESYIPYFAIEKVPASAWEATSCQQALMDHFRYADFELQNFILNRVEKIPLSPEALEVFISAIGDLRTSQMVKALAVVQNNTRRLGEASWGRLVKLKDHPDKEIAAAVRKILENRNG